MDEKSRSRKFSLAVSAMYAVTAALFTHFITGAEFINGILYILGMYGAANVWETKT